MSALAATLLALALPAQSAATAATAAAEAEALVKAGDFAGATEAYRSALEAGAVNADLLYNLGTAALKAGDVGSAVLHLERAHRLAPGDEDVTFNLTRALEHVGGPLGPTARQARQGQLLLRLPLSTWQLWTLIGFACALVLTLVRTLLRWHSTARTLVSAAAAAVWLLALGLGIGTWARFGIAARGDAVVVGGAATTVYEAPDHDAPAAFVLEPGHPVRIVTGQAHFARIRLVNGLEGWIDRTRVVEVEGRLDDAALPVASARR